MTRSKQAMRVALYARVSTSDQDPEMQLEELKQAATQRGWAVADVYCDTISGSKEGPERTRMLRDAHVGRFDTVMVWRFDRFGRSSRDLLLAVDTLFNLGVGFCSMREAFDTSTPIGKATLTILSAVAELERNIIRERVIGGLERAKRKGVKLGRPEREVDIERAKEMLAAGRTQRQVAMALRVPRTTLRRALARAVETPGPKSPPKKSDANPSKEVLPGGWSAE